MLVDAFEEDKIRIAKTGLEGPVQHVTMFVVSLSEAIRNATHLGDHRQGA